MNVQAGDPGVVVSLGGSQDPVVVQPTPVPTPDPTVDSSLAIESEESVEDPLEEVSEAPVLELDEIVVTATRSEQDILDIPRTVTVITREEIESQSSITRNLFEILGNTVPGFGPPNQSDRNNAQLFRGREALVLIDGVPQNSNFYGSIGLRGFDPNIVERIEVVSGPTGLYGAGAAGGLINIITRQASEQTISRLQIGTATDLGELESGGFSYSLSYNLSGKSDPVNYVLNLSGQLTNQFRDAEGDIIPQDNPTLAGATIVGFLGKLGVELNEEQRLELSANFANDVRDVDFIVDLSTLDIPGRQKARALQANQQYINLKNPGNQTLSFNLSYTHDNLLNSRFSAQAYYWRNEDRAFPFDDRGENSFYDAITVFSPFIADAVGGRAQFDTSLLENIQLVWGIDYRNERNELILEIIDPVEFDRSGGTIIRSIDEQNLLPPYSIDQLGLFAQGEWNLSDQLILSGGIRQEFVELSVDDYTTFFGDDIVGGTPDFDATVFNVGSVYKLTEDLSTYLSFSQGFSVPLLFSLATAPAGTSIERGFSFLEPQTVDNYEIGFRGLWPDLQATLSVYYSYSELGTFFSFNPEDTVGILTRAPQRNYGVEATVDWQTSDRWQLGGSLTWHEGEADSDEDGEFTALSSFDVQPTKITAYVEHQTLPSWNNRLQFLYSGNRIRGFEDVADGVSIESYVTLDYISDILLGDGVLSLGIENLLDNQYFPVFSQVLSGFNEVTYRAARGRRLNLTYTINW
ncbi:MAG: TonB-dependent receptor [Synechococcaceae cyanobacterium SM2_3_1]|nr:TonB-dependent receptor [Synechococcaceae cyanobacterium SM2_3_1]